MFHRSRRATLSTTAMIFSVLLLIAGISMEMANRKHTQPMATISIACSTARLVSGIAAYVVNRLDRNSRWPHQDYGQRSIPTVTAKWLCTFRLTNGANPQILDQSMPNMWPIGPPRAHSSGA